MGIQEQTLSTKIYLYGIEKGKKEKYPVYARIIFRREKADISMKMTARADEWDFENQMFFPAKASNRYKNNKLLSCKDQLQKIFNDLKQENIFFSVKSVRKKFRGEVEDSSSMKFLDFYDSYVNDCKNRPQEFKEGVILHYSKTKRHLINYMRSKGILNISLKEISRIFIVNFEQHLLSTPIEKKDYSMNRNTCCLYLKKVKAVINRALEKELIEKNPFLGYKLPKFEASKIIYLTGEELELIKNSALNKSLSTARDIFLFSCFCGLRYSDASNLKNSNIKKDRLGMLWIHLQQQKTRGALEVPMMKEAIEIYNKYESHRALTGNVLPKLCNQKINSYLKIIAELSGVDKHISHHTARHTFATYLLEKGVELKTVSRFMGHVSIKSTEIYAKVTKKKLTDTIQKLNNDFSK